VTTIQIPETIDAARVRLDGIESLLTATEWERAAIVWAFTEDGTNGRPSDRKPSALSRFSAEEFAALGIQGLRSGYAVRRYRRAWSDEVGEATIAPGDRVVLPVGPFPHSRNHIDGTASDGIRDNLYEDTPPERQAEAVQKILARNAEVARRVENGFVQKAGQDTELAHRVYRAYGEHHPTPIKEKPAPSSADLGFGSEVYERVRTAQKFLPPLLDYITARLEAEYPKTQEVMQEEIDGLEKAKGLIDQYIDKIRETAGVDVDTVFNRLVGRE
jgi:hypothetical protein